MEGAQATAQDERSTAFQGFVGSTKSEDVQKNPHAYRFAYMPGVWLAKADPLLTGYSFFPQGSLIGFKTFQRGGLFDFVAGINGTSPVNNRIGEVSAEFALYHAKIEFQAIEGYDLGFRPFDQLVGDPLAEHYFAAIHPAFELVDHTCPRNLEVCPTCRKSVLPVSDKDVSDFLVIYKQNNKLEAKLDIDVAKSVRDVIAESCNAFITTSEGMWTELSDQKERTRNSSQPCVLQPSHYHYRNVLHILDPMEHEEQKELRLASMIANATKGKEASSDAVGELRDIIMAQQAQIDALLKSQSQPKSKSKEKTEDAEA